VSSEQIKHLEFIQNIITRMNTNSFQIKGWMIALVSAFLALSASTKNDYFVLVALFPTVFMWFLDAFYLMQERKFRGLYDDVAGISKNPQELKQFAMRPDLYVGKKYSYRNSFFSSTVFKLYVSIFVGLVTLFVCF